MSLDRADFLALRLEREYDGVIGAVPQRRTLPIFLASLVVKFSELVRLVEQHGFSVVRQKGSVRYYGKSGWPNLVRIDYHGAKEVPTGTCNAILKSAGIPKQ